MSADDAREAALLRARAARVRAAAETLRHGADHNPKPGQDHLLRLQAQILADGAARLDDEALAVEPAKGRA